MTDETIHNPYHADYAEDSVTVPFAGRKQALGRLYQQLNDPAADHALLILGHRRVGKTTFLRNFDALYGDAYAGVYINLQEAPPENLEAFVLTLAQNATQMLVEREFTVRRLADLEPPADDPESWFATTFLPHIFSAIRPHRDLVFLIDDVDRLIFAVKQGRLPASLFKMMQSWLTQFKQLNFVLTMDTEYESEISALAPLTSDQQMVRIGHLAPDETRWIMQEPIRGVYSVTDDAVTQIHRATGGMPGLVQHAGYQMFRRWYVAPDNRVFTAEDAKQIIPIVYDYGEPDFRVAWGKLSLNERLVLTAISGLSYENPLRLIDPAEIESWLVETDYPMDLMTINAILRSLEYREVIANAPDGVRIISGMWQTWLLDNAQIVERTPEPIRKNNPSRVASPPLGKMLTIAIVVGVILAILILLIISGNSAQNEADLARTLIQPTVTLFVQP